METEAGMRVLLVEDEYLLADHLADVLGALGATPVGPAGSVVHALQLIDRAGRIDGAILDVELDGERVYPVADALRERGIPFVFSTGYGGDALPERFRDMPVMDKLVTMKHVRGALDRLH
jgi:CheY-like chemotaxis protein